MCDSIIYLIGFSGTGKTTVGEKVARILDTFFLDMDSKIAEDAQQSIPEIFSSVGEDVFRKMETDLIKKISNSNSEKCCSAQVVSTGGGVWSVFENRQLMYSSGIVICLNASPETILMRLERQQLTEGSIADRPMLYSGEGSLNKVKELLQIRYENYMKADFILQTDAKTPLSIAEEIEDLLK